MRPKASVPASAEATDPPSPRHALVALALMGVLVLYAAAQLVPRLPDRPPRLEDIGGTLDCRQRPRFAAAAGFETGSALSTGEGAQPGLVLVDATAPERSYQHPSWARHGFLGPLTYDAEGNVYVAPMPNISLLENPPEEQNSIYRVDTESGEMDLFLQLPPGGPLKAENPFGILGLTYDCDTGSLYASSVAGSTRSQEFGRILRIDPADATVTDSMSEVDAMGLAVFRGSRDRRLYFGSARRPELWSIALDDDGAFLGSARRELQLPGWSDKARRIIFDAEGGMEVLGVPFVFNLALGVDDPENAYGFRYDPMIDTWRIETMP